jgi:hypothetical protein
VIIEYIADQHERLGQISHKVLPRQEADAEELYLYAGDEGRQEGVQETGWTTEPEPAA